MLIMKLVCLVVVMDVHVYCMNGKFFCFFLASNCGEGQQMNVKVSWSGNLTKT